MIKWISDFIKMIFPSLVKNKEVENQKPIEEQKENTEEQVTETPEKEPIEVLIEAIEEEAKPKKNPNKNRLIIFNPGHGLNTKGKQTPDGIKEYEFNKPIAERAVAYAKSLGFEALIANQYDIEDPNPTKALSIAVGHVNRIALQANKEGKDVICISVHANAHQTDPKKIEWNSASGTVTFFWERITRNKQEQSEKGKKLAIAIHKEMVEKTGLMDRAYSFNRGEAVGANFGVLRETLCPTALVECAFMTNKNDADFLKSDIGKTICAKAMIDGAYYYFQNK